MLSHRLTRLISSSTKARYRGRKGARKKVAFTAAVTPIQTPTRLETPGPKNTPEEKAQDTPRQKMEPKNICALRRGVPASQEKHIR